MDFGKYIPLLGLGSSGSFAILLSALLREQPPPGCVSWPPGRTSPGMVSSHHLRKGVDTFYSPPRFLPDPPGCGVWLPLLLARGLLPLRTDNLSPPWLPTGLDTWGAKHTCLERPPGTAGSVPFLPKRAPGAKSTHVLFPRLRPRAL